MSIRRWKKIALIRKEVVFWSSIFACLCLSFRHVCL